MAETKRGRGCFFYGCLTLALVAVVGVVALYFGARYAIKQVVARYTSATPVEVAPIKLSPAEGDKAVKRLDEFTRSLQAGGSPSPFELSSDELDYLIRNSRDFSQFRDSAHFSVTNDQIQAELSFPLGSIRPELTGRFLNANAAFGLQVQNGEVALTVSSVEVNGQAAPREFLMEMFKAQGRNEGLRWQPQPTDAGAALLTNLSKIEIKSDKVILHPN